jgi:hypothetical protein
VSLNRDPVGQVLDALRDSASSSRVRSLGSALPSLNIAFSRASTNWMRMPSGV